MDGFYVGNKFLVREIGWYTPLFNVNEAYGVQHFTHDWVLHALPSQDQRHVCYVKRHITGLTFRPSPMEYYLHGDDLPGQDQVATHVEQLWKHYKTPDCNTVACKGGTLEFVLLTLLCIPSLDLEKLGCPTFNQLQSNYVFPRCSCHIHPNVHCAMSECFVFSKWFVNKCEK